MDDRDDELLPDENAESDEADLLEFEQQEEQQLNQRQFALGTLFFLITVAALYFAVERYSGGRFALFTVIVLAVLAPLLYILSWLTRALFEAGLIGTLVGIAVLAALIVLGLLAIFGI